jgi:hypothetical protein
MGPHIPGSAGKTSDIFKAVDTVHFLESVTVFSNKTSWTSLGFQSWYGSTHAMKMP